MCGQGVITWIHIQQKNSQRDQNLIWISGSEFQHNHLFWFNNPTSLSRSWETTLNEPDLSKSKTQADGFLEQNSEIFWDSIILDAVIPRKS